MVTLIERDSSCSSSSLKVKRYQQHLRRSLRDMSFSDPEHLPRIGTCPADMGSLGRSIRRPGHHHQQQQQQRSSLPRLPASSLLLRRQNTWHDVSVLKRDVDVIEQITTSV